MLVREDGIVLLVSQPINREAFVGLPAPDCPLAAIEGGRDLFPRLECFLRLVSLRHSKTCPETIQHNSFARAIMNASERLSG
jgi:hypothetical protein